MLYKNILLALDGTESEKTVVKEAFRLTADLNANLTILHINDPAAGKPHMMMDGLPFTDEVELREILAGWGYANEIKNVKIVILQSEQYAKEIAENSKNFDLLIIGHHPKNAFLAAITDSTDERVLDLVSIPMLVLPCKE